MSLGPLMLNVEGLALDLEDREILTAPVVGGVIVFARNYESPRQLRALVEEIHELREPRLLVAVDQEGGRVQRFRDGFTALPPPRRIGELFDREPARALALAESLGWLLAAELRAFEIDLTFAPVLDLGRYRQGVIGDRAFHRDAQAVAELARAELKGLAAGGMTGVGKHFPGHGSVRGDSHHLTPVDERDLETIGQCDMAVFERMIHYGLAAVMGSHIVFPSIDAAPVCCSAIWLRDILRGRLGFTGAVFSDDLSMKGAEAGGDIVARSQAALDAGCDMILVCNDRGAAARVAERLQWRAEPASGARLARMRGMGHVTEDELRRLPRYARTVADLESLSGG